MFFDVLPGAVGKLAAGLARLADDAGRLAVVIAENVMQQEHRPLDRRQPLEQQQERHRQRVGLLGQIGRVSDRRVAAERLTGDRDERLWQPLPHVGLLSGPGRAELVDAEPGGHRRQVRLRRVGLARPADRSVVSKERFLHDVLGLGYAA